MYGSLSMRANVFAGQPEYFSAAVTSTSRIANILISQEQSIRANELSAQENIDTRYGSLTYLDNVVQADTDSVIGSSIVIVDGVDVTIEELFEKASGNIEKKSKFNLIKHIDKDYFTLSLNRGTGDIEPKKIKYVMAHKVKKRLYEISYKDKIVTVTEDHSIIVKRDNMFVDVKPSDIIESDELITI